MTIECVEQELLSLSAHRVLSDVLDARSLVLCVVLYIVVCPFVQFILGIALPAPLQVAASDFIFGIFELSLCWLD